jgi:hypothetical protein
MSVNTTQTYLDLITSEYQGQPDFAATITSVVEVLVQIQTLLESMIAIFDLDLIPVGNQLDIIGQWVGASRNLANPFSGVYFSWNDTAADGWDSGIWSDGQTVISTLPDDVYLTYINAKIAINQWDGTTNGIYEIWANVLPQYQIAIQDNQNMSFVAIVAGQAMDSLTKALLTGGYLVPRPEGVEIAYYVNGQVSGPIFAWDADSSTLQGWDLGAWGVILQPT